MIIDQATRDRIAAAFDDATLTLVSGGGRCTIEEINFVLTGKLTDGPHPCISEVIRRWVIRTQDAMPHDMRNSHAWRDAAKGIAGSAATPAVEKRRRDLITDWMWSALADEAVVSALPAKVKPSWQAMLRQRTAAAAHITADTAYAAYADAAYAAASAAAHTDTVYIAHYFDAAASAAASAAAYVAHAAAADTDAAYWRRRDPAALLVRLIEVAE